MAEFSYPFDGGTGAIITEDDWSDMARNWQDDGLIAPSISTSTSLLAEASGDNSITLSEGMVVIQGFLYRNSGPLPLTFATNSDANPRRDSIVLRLDRNSNTVQAVVKQGTPAPSPVSPALDTTYPIYEMPVASFRINAGSATATSISTERPFASRYIRVSTTNVGQPEGSLIYNHNSDRLYFIPRAPRSPIMIAEGGTLPEEPAPGYTLKTKDSDGSDLTGSSVILDPTLVLTFPAAGRYRVKGITYLSTNTASSSCQMSLTSTPTPTYVKGVFEKHDGFAIATSTTNPIQLNATTSGNYAITYDFTFNVTGIQTVQVRTHNHSASSIWRVLQGSYIRMEEVTI
jgi:hypothetical protein